MINIQSNQCPLEENTDHRKSAAIAAKFTKLHPGAHLVKSPVFARSILRHKKAKQAGASADQITFKNPEQAPVFFLDGEEHSNKRRKTQRFLSPKAISGQHLDVMRRVSDELIRELQQRKTAKLEDLSFSLAIEVVGEILGLTNSPKLSRAMRIQKVLESSVSQAGNSKLSKLWLNLKRAVAMSRFYWFDVRPSINERKLTPKDDAISFYIEEGYSKLMIVIECVTYGTAGMLTTREFIIMAAWYLFENEDLKQRFLQGDSKDQLAILMEILRLEPVAAMIYRRVNEDLSDDHCQTFASGEKYGIDIRNANIDAEAVGDCPFALDPERAKRQKKSGKYLSFGDGQHTCPGWQVALQETRIFLEQLMKVPGIKLERVPDISWNAQLGSYELRNADISCN